MRRAKADSSSVSKPEATESAPVSTPTQPISVQSAAEAALMYVHFKPSFNSDEMIPQFILRAELARFKLDYENVIFSIVLDPAVMNTIQW